MVFLSYFKLQSPFSSTETIFEELIQPKMKVVIICSLSCFKEKKNWTVAQWSKVLWWKYILHFIWKSGGRVERHRIHVACSPVWSFHSQWWLGLSCRLLVLVHCVFWSPVNTAIYQEILEPFMLPSDDKLYGDADFIFNRIWHLSTLPNIPKASSMTMVLLCLIGQ